MPFIKDFLPPKKVLPTYCFAVSMTDPLLVTALKRGSTGYWVRHRETTSAAALTYCNEQNAAMGVSSIEAQAMVNGAMFGWDHPAADAIFLARLIKNWIHKND